MRSRVPWLVNDKIPSPRPSPRLGGEREMRASVVSIARVCWFAGGKFVFRIGRANHNFSVEKIIMAGDVPSDADSPKTVLQADGVERLDTVAVGFESELLVQSGG